MARLQSPSGTLKALLHEYGGWIVILFTVYVIWTFRGVFSAVGETATATANAATAKVKAAATSSAAKQAVKTATASSREPTDAEIAKWTADATTLAAYFDATSTFSLSRNQAAAFALLKQGYSRLNLYLNKPFYYKTVNGKKTIVSQTVATSASVTNVVNWKVLVPFYKEVTDGRDLLHDIHEFIYDSDYKKLLSWIL